MTEEKLKHYKEILIEEKKEILKEIIESDESLKDMFENDSHNVTDSVDEASFTITQNILNSLNTKNQQTLLAIEAALRRIEEGSFGICISCSKEISETRLEAIPWATKCIECKNKEEKRK